MTKEEAKIKFENTKKIIENLNTKKEFTSNVKEKIDIISKKVDMIIYADVLESFIDMNDLEFNNLKKYIQQEYEFKKEENKKVKEALISGEKIKVNKYTFTVLKNYKEILKKIKANNKSNTIRLVA